jgi:hypothetical protein
MAHARLQRGTGGFAARPSPLTGNEGDRRPMVGHNGVQDTDDADGKDKQKFRAERNSGLRQRY